MTRVLGEIFLQQIEVEMLAVPSDPRYGERPRIDIIGDDAQRIRACSCQRRYATTAANVEYFPAEKRIRLIQNYARQRCARRPRISPERRGQVLPRDLLSRFPHLH